MDPAQAQCASDHCCSEFTACGGSPDCLAVAACFFQCIQSADAGMMDNGNMCRMQCEADASATGASDFDAGFMCFRMNCSNIHGGRDAAAD
jgi:hypothetical protein